MIRRATINDADTLYAYRINDERRNGGIRTTREQHYAWLKARIHNPLIDIYMYEAAGIPAGMLRIDSNGELAFHINGHQWSSDLLLGDLRDLAWKHGGRLKAMLDTDDTQKIHALEQAGFTIHPATFLTYKPQNGLVRYWREHR